MMLGAAVLLLASFVAGAESLPPALQAGFNRAVAAIRARDFATAETLLRRVTEKAAGFAPAHHNLGVALQERGAHAGAVVQFRRVAAAVPRHAPAHLLMGVSLAALGRHTEAIAAFARAVRLAPRDPEARLQLASAYERSGQPLRAIEHLEAARAAAPADPEQSYRIAAAYNRISAWSVERLLAAAPQSGRMLQLRGEIFGRQGQSEKAIEAYRKAAEAEPDLPGTHLAIAMLYLQANQIEEARSAIDRELAVSPESAVAKALAARLRR